MFQRFRLKDVVAEELDAVQFLVTKGINQSCIVVDLFWIPKREQI